MDARGKPAHDERDLLPRNHRVGKGATRRAHRSTCVGSLVGTLRFAHPTAPSTLRLRYRVDPNRLLKLSRLTSPRAWRPSPILRAPSNEATSKRITRRSTESTVAMVRTVAPTGEAARCLISTSVPTVIQPRCRWG